MLYVRGYCKNCGYPVNGDDEVENPPVVVCNICGESLAVLDIVDVKELHKLGGEVVE